MYGYMLHSRQPIETYNTFHAAVAEIVGANDPEGLLVHLAYATEEGFTLLEVWESKAQVEDFDRVVIPDAMRRSGVTEEQLQAQRVEFEPVEVITPRVHTPMSR